MAMTVEITQYDPITKKYTAVGIVNEGFGEQRYSVEGTWHPEDAKMVAGALYDQYLKAKAVDAMTETVKMAMITTITAEIAKLEVK
jgi:hypothetical protein